MSTQRIYIVTPKATEGQLEPKQRLVRASNRVQALRHVACEFAVDLPSQDDLVKLVTGGTAVEDARDEA